MDNKASGNVSDMETKIEINAIETKIELKAYFPPDVPGIVNTGVGGAEESTREVSQSSIPIGLPHDGSSPNLQPPASPLPEKEAGMTVFSMLEELQSRWHGVHFIVMGYAFGWL